MLNYEQISAKMDETNKKDPLILKLRDAYQSFMAEHPQMNDADEDFGDDWEDTSEIFVPTETRESKIHRLCLENPLLTYQHNLFLFAHGMQNSLSPVKIVDKDMMLNIAMNYFANDSQGVGKYIGPLEELGARIKSAEKVLIMADLYFVPNIIAAIEELKTNPDFIEQMIAKWAKVLNAVPQTPVEALKSLFTNEEIDGDKHHFKHMLSHYCKDNPRLKTELNNLASDLKLLAAKKIAEKNGAEVKLDNREQVQAYLNSTLGCPAGARRFNRK